MKRLSITCLNWKYIALLQIILFSSFADGQEALEIRQPESRNTSSTSIIKVEASQQISFQVELSHITATRQSDNLVITFLQSPDETQDVVTLESFFSVIPVPTIYLLDNSIHTPMGFLEATAAIQGERDIASEIAEIQALIESGDDIELPDTAAGSPASASVPLFSFLGGNLTKRFNSFFSSDSESSYSIDASDPQLNTLEVSTSNANSSKANPLRQSLLALAIVHSKKELELHHAYSISIHEINERVQVRSESGLGSINDSLLATIWITSGKQKQAQIETALEIAVDDYEALMGNRPEPFSSYPEKWQESILPTLSQQLEKIAVNKHKTARELWRFITLEKNNLILQEQQVDMSKQFSEAYLQQFDIGQRILTDLVSAVQSSFEHAIRENEMHYRMYIGLANLHALTGKLPAQLPKEWATALITEGEQP